MKQILKVIAILCAIIPLPSFAQPRETITIVADKWCPYNCGENDAKQGYIIDVVRAAMAKNDIDVVYKVIPWAQAVSKTRGGAYDAIVGANMGDAPDFIFPEQVQGISIIQAWVKPDAAWVYDAPASLDNLRVGIVGGYSYGKGIDDYLKKRAHAGDKNLFISNTINATDENIKALLDGKVDTILEDKNVIEYYFASRKLPVLIKPAGNPVSVDRSEDTLVFVAFSPKKPESKRYAALLAEGMIEMRKNGELNDILARYNMNGIFRFQGPESSNLKSGL